MRATIFFLTFAIFVAALVLRVDQVIFGDKLASGEAQSRVQMASMSQALSSEIQSLKDILTLSFTEIERGRGDYSAGRPYSRFQMLAKLSPPNPKEDRREWQILSSYFLEKSAAKNWATPYVTLALKSVVPGEVRPGGAYFYALMDPQRKPFLLMLYNSSGSWYSGLLGSETFQALMDRQKGQKSTVFIVNLQGQALAHTTQEYIGSLLTEDPLVNELIKSSVGSGFGSFRDLKGESIQGLYEQIENTNLYAVITTPVKVLSAGRDSTRLQLLLLGIGLGLIGVAIFFFTDRGETPAPMQAKPPPLVAPAAPVPATVNSAQTPQGADKMKAYVQVASSLSHELKSPLTSILGYSQLAMNQMPEGGPKEHLQKIDAEARSVREIIQKLLIFAGEDKMPSQNVSLEMVVGKALKNLEGRLLSKGIKVIKNFQPVPAFTMPVDLVVRAIENVLINSIEAMERAPRKELTLGLKTEGEQILLSIDDTGEGIAAANMGKVFDPFFTTKGNVQHVGLGLSTALGIFKEISGEMQMDSQQGQGTKTLIRFSPDHIQTTEAVPAAPPPAPALTMKAPAPASAPGFPLSPPPAPAQAAKPIAAVTPVKESPMDSLLVDNTIERLIEGDVPDMPPPPDDGLGLDVSAEVLKAPPKQKDPEDTELLLDIPDISEDALREEEDPEELSLMAPPAPKAPPAPAPPPIAAAPTTPAAEKPAFSAKIDKPKIDIKKKTSRVDEEVQISIRRPGERQ
jgi:signal transduction histidine kinase